VSAYLLPIAEREPLAWIVAAQRTALPATRRREAAAVVAGDRLFLYTTRGCFHNPTRDRGRVIGNARLTDAAAPLAEPVIFGGRQYDIGLDFEIETLTHFRDGVELAPLVRKLRGSFPDPHTWSGRMRRALVPLHDVDADFLARRVAEVALPYPTTLAEYAA
jgi:hypothetical protein